ncbi:MAG: tetratricopeptide repeat protein [Magnetococcales bacterium]|nr:tetratricopeptide repeat protein [Magnetococcales bacterium]
MNWLCRRVCCILVAGLLIGGAERGFCDATAAELVEAGVIAARQHDFRQAIADFDQALTQPELTPRERAVTLNNRGNARKKLGLYEEAYHDYTLALRLDPDRPKPLHDRGVVRFLQGQFFAAALDLQEFLRREPDMASPYPYLWLYLARARAENEKNSGHVFDHTPFQEQITWPGPLIRLHREALDVDMLLSFTGDRSTNKHMENQCDAFFHIGEYHLLRGNRQEARRWFDKTLATGMQHLDEYAAARAERQALELDAPATLPSLLELDPEAVYSPRPESFPERNYPPPGHESGSKGPAPWQVQDGVLVGFGAKP